MPDLNNLITQVFLRKGRETHQNQTEKKKNALMLSFFSQRQRAPYQ